MTVRLDGELIRLEGDCPVEDAEALAALLQRGLRAVDIAQCGRMHGAVAQALLAFGAEPFGAPRAEFLREQLAPALQRARRNGSG
jgi:hypothetical protein